MGYGYVLLQDEQGERPWQRIRAQRLDAAQRKELAGRVLACVAERFPDNADANRLAEVQHHNGWTLG